MKVQASSDAYRAVWRWHFYAGLLVMPILMLMALTGGIYLFKPEIEDALNRPMAEVRPGAARSAPDSWLAAAVTAGGGAPVSVLAPDRGDRAVQVRVRSDAGERTVFVDPYTAEVTGVRGGEGLMGTVKGLHSLDLLGSPFNILVEIVAGWAIILVATGLFLWWPRGGSAAAAIPRRGDPRRRPFWRDLHAVTGLYAGGVIFFLAVTGMPWSAVWGDAVLGMMRQSGLGRPAAPAEAGPWIHAPRHERPEGQGWTLQGSVLKASVSGSPSLGRVIAAAEARGLPAPYIVSIPDRPALAWTVARATERAGEARSLHVDARSGQVRADVSWSEFGAGAKAFEWGIAVHQGVQYGWINRIVMLAGCVAVWVLGVSGLFMWWKRRPASGRLHAPVAPAGRGRAAVVGIVLPLAVLFPLTGLSLCAALAADLVWRAAERRSTKAASS